MERIEDDRTGSVGVKQAAIVRAVAMSTLNMRAAKREQANQPKVMTIAKSNGQFDFFLRLYALRMTERPDMKPCRNMWKKRHCKNGN